MMKKEELEKRIEKHKKRLAECLQDAEGANRDKVRKVRKRLKRAQRKLTSLIAHEKKVGSFSKKKDAAAEEPAAG